MKYKNGFIDASVIIAVSFALALGSYALTAPKKTYRPAAKPSIGLFGERCEGKGSSKLKTFPLEPKNIEFIMPMGRVQDSHVTPTDHQYIVPLGTKSGSLVTDNPYQYEIKAPLDGYIVTIELFKEPVEAEYRNQKYQNNYLVLFQHSCDFYTRLIHIDTLSPQIFSAFKFRDPNSQHPYASTRIKVKEGEVIGTVGPHSFDFQIIDRRVKDPNLISPQNIDPWSAYTVDTFKYLVEPLRSELLKKNLTKHEPLGGKISYDVPGTLLGNWFLVGRSKAREAYWKNNLSIVYDHLDPSQIRVAFGDFDGRYKSFGVMGNAPDPVLITVGSLPVKYELVGFEYYSAGKKWDGLHYSEDLKGVNDNYNDNYIVGTVLFELVDGKQLKMETFPGKKASEVIGFTSAAKLYER